MNPTSIVTSEPTLSEQQGHDYRAAIADIAALEATYQAARSAESTDSVALQAWHWCTWVGELHLSGLTQIFITGKPSFSGSGFDFSGTLDSLGVTVASVLSGYGLFHRDPATLVGQKIWCSAVGLLPGPGYPNFVATFYLGSEYLGSLSAWILGLHVAFRATGYVDWRR
jgi:hypothetical protein